MTVHTSSNSSLSHQMHSNPVPRFAERQLEHSDPSCVQSYSVTVGNTTEVMLCMCSAISRLVVEKLWLKKVHTCTTIVEEEL